MTEPEPPRPPDEPAEPVEPRPGPPVEPPPVEPAPVEPRAERRRVTGAAVLGIALALLGVAWLLAALDVFDLDAELWIGLLLIAVGAAVVLLPAGIGRGLLIVLGILLALAGAAVATVDVDLSGGIGEDKEHPRTVADLDDRYELGIGSLKIDLTDLEVDGSAQLDAQVGIGELVVAVPPGVTVVVDAHTGAGDIQALGEEESGFDADMDETFERGSDTLTVKAEVGIGAIKVQDFADF
ncbi:MAG TPA: LiaF domain-containing protein [Gaiellaceae bacterium]|nr:LiaF domain-containing protein [Gaiellaceae bacterium]